MNRISACRIPTAIILVVVTVFYHCGTSPKNENEVSINALSSDCGGFASLSKRSVVNLDSLDTVACLEETLFWRWDSASQTLTFVHRDVSAPCGSQLQMYVMRAGDVYTIGQRDLNASGHAACECTYDLSCEVPQIGPGTVTVVLDTFHFSLALSEGSGREIIRPLMALDLLQDSIADLSQLSEYPCLAEIDNLDAHKYPDLTPIARAPRLTRLSIINVDSLMFLTGADSLASLDIRGTFALTDISPLALLPALRSLDLAACSSLTDLSPLGRIDRCSTLTLTDCPEITSLAGIGPSAFLQCINVSGCPSLTNCSALAGLVGLHSFSLDSAKGVEDLSWLTPLRHLTNLRLVGLSKATTLSPLASCTELERLEIGGNAIVTDISPLAGLSSLHELILSNMTAIRDFSPLAACLDSGDLFCCPGTPVPQTILDQLRQKGVAYKF